MNKARTKLLLAAMLLTFAWPPHSPAAPPPVDPEQFYRAVMANPRLDTPQAGEGWAWHAAWSLGHFCRAYRAWGDVAWLEQAARYHDYLLGRLSTGPDGYKGWIGPHIGGREDRRQDTHMGDAILFEHLLDFARIVRADPELEKTFGRRAQRYIDLVEKHLFEKWDARGTYHRDGPIGAYNVWAHYLPEGGEAWVHDPQLEAAAITQQFNKQKAMATNALYLYQLTGRAQHRRRAFELFAFTKSRLQLHAGAYCWNFREPLHPDDVTSLEDDTVRTWIAAHPHRAGYQAKEVSRIVEAYHHGLVFDRTDIERLVKANLEVMWNGDRDDPRFNGPEAAFHPRPAAPGTLWTALEDFSQTVRDLRRFGDDARGRIDRAYFENVTLAREAGFDRLHVDDQERIEVFDFPHTETRSLNAAFILGMEITPGRSSAILGARSLRSGELRIELRDQSGDNLLFELARRDLRGSPGGRGGMDLRTWDGTGPDGEPPPPGTYRLRWHMPGHGHREHPVHILPTDAP